MIPKLVFELSNNESRFIHGFIKNGNFNDFFRCDEYGKFQHFLYKRIVFKTIGVVDIRVKRNIFELAFFDSDGWMCYLKSGINFRWVNHPRASNTFKQFQQCIPSNLILGCPQEFCVTTVIDDLLKHNSFS